MDNPETPLMPSQSKADDKPKKPAHPTRSLLLRHNERIYGLARVNAELYEEAARIYGQKSLLIARLASWLYQAESYIQERRAKENGWREVARPPRVYVTKRGVRMDTGRRCNWRGTFGKSRDELLNELLAYVIKKQLVAPEISGSGGKEADFPLGDGAAKADHREDGADREVQPGGEK